MTYELDKSLWTTCKICGTKIHAGSGKYLSQQFIHHIKHQHKDISIEQYFINLGISQPVCKCGCGKHTKITYKGSKLIWRLYACGRNDGVKKWSKEAKTNRIGDKNPMYGKKPWNKQQTKNTNKSLMTVAQKLTGRKISTTTKLKQSISARKRIVHGHTGHKHTEETKTLLRQHTLKMIHEGKIPQTDTLPCRIVAAILDELNITYIKEYICSFWSFDFYIPDSNVYIEVDGDYFHSNPIIYTNGPQTKTQKRNHYRDIKKNQYCTQNNMKLIRIWEYDIINHREKVKDALRKNCIN